MNIYESYCKLTSRHDKMFFMFRRFKLPIVSIVIVVIMTTLVLGNMTIYPKIKPAKKPKPKVTLRKVADGLFVAHVNCLWDQLLLHFAKYIKAKKSFTPEVLERYGIIKWDAFDETGGRLRNFFVYTKDEFPTGIVPEIDYFLEINDQAIAQVIKKFPELNAVEQSPGSYWKKQYGNHFYHPDPVQGLEIFGDHCDFGGMASAFTFQADGRGFKYYKNDTWKEVVLKKDEFLINMGMEFQCITGMRAIRHKVVSNSDKSCSLQRRLTENILAAASANEIDITKEDTPICENDVRNLQQHSRRVFA